MVTVALGQAAVRVVSRPWCCRQHGRTVGILHYGWIDVSSSISSHRDKRDQVWTSSSSTPVIT